MGENFVDDELVEGSTIMGIKFWNGKLKSKISIWNSNKEVDMKCVSTSLFIYKFLYYT